jgi:cobalamin biosynthesis protein CbiD
MLAEKKRTGGGCRAGGAAAAAALMRLLTRACAVRAVEFSTPAGRVVFLVLGLPLAFVCIL